MSVPVNLLHEFFHRSVDRWPEVVAIDVPPGLGRPERQTLTYGALARQSGGVAAVLRPLVVAESVVAILAGRDSALLYSGQLATLECGAAFTCLDLSMPDEQIRNILADAGAVAVLADAAGCRRLAHGFPGLPPIIDLSTIVVSRPPAAAASRPSQWLTPRSLAYLIYTSGTSGRPKGVMIEHHSVANLVSGDIAEFGLAPGDRVAQSSSAAYDSSIEEIWLALAVGATLVVMDDQTARLGPDLVPWLRDERISVWCPAPSLLRATGCTEPETALPGLRLLYVGGEALTDDVADRWARGRCLVNGYGPTEATVTTIRERIAAPGAIAIGKPIPGVQAWVLNDHGDDTVDGARGELYLGGAALARGYWNQPELTGQKFLQHPRFGRIYRTGDIAHREADGRFFCHGRVDAQVKLRGYRIELEAIEARLAECPGVRQAVCTVQGHGGRQSLVAFVVPDRPEAPPDAERLRASLARVLPSYMVPARVGALADLPTTLGGKLDRARLPRLDGPVDGRRPRQPVAPASSIETRLAAAFTDVLQPPHAVSVHDDFFDDLGGDSLSAGLLISRLRADPLTSAVSTRDLYEVRTVAALATRAVPAPPLDAPVERPPVASLRQTVLVTVAQAGVLAAALLVSAPIAYGIAFGLVPGLLRAVGPVGLVLLLPWVWAAGRAVFAPLSVALAVALKTLLIGRYTARRVPAWSGEYLRHWIVEQAASLIPWTAIAGTEFQNMALRALGARIGRGVHIHRGVDLRRGGWDLLQLGDFVTVGRDASLRLVEVEDGHLILGPITLADEVTLDVRAGVAGHASIGRTGTLAAWSSLSAGTHLPAGERWDGIPAAPAGHTPPAHLSAPGIDPLTHAVAAVAARSLLWFLMTLPLDLIAIGWIVALRLDASSLLDLAFGVTSWTLPGLISAAASAIVAPPLMLAFEAAAVRALGRSPHQVVSRWSWCYLRVWLKTLVVESAGTWLSGTLFWPWWLRAAGMTVGRGCEISTIIDTVPDLVTIGHETFLADGVYLNGPRIDRGTVALAPTCLGAGTFVGNHAVVPAGAALPPGLLIGVCTVADERTMGMGTGWFGHPPIALPRRDPPPADRRLTHDPSPVRYWNRVFWEVLRLVLPLVPLTIAWAWFAGVGAMAELWSPTAAAAGAAGLTFAGAASLCLTTLALKWLLLGRVTPGSHALWSCWCSRWDFLYVAWTMYTRRVLGPLEGTLWLTWYLRAMGMTIGRRVLLGPGFSQVVDPDMLVIEDGATVSTLFQAHTFEDRILKIDRVHVGRDATLGAGSVALYGARVGAAAWVEAHSVIMKGEHVPAGARYVGAPVRREDVRNSNA